jgi:hypothetical protein
MTTPTTFAGLVDELLGLINIIIPVIFGFIFVFLIWKIFDAWVINAADERKREEGKKYAVVSVIVVVVMTMIWGIVTLLRESIFGVI